MPGKFERAPAHAEYLWALVSVGIGTEKRMGGTLCTHIRIEPEDVSLYPTLVLHDWWCLWEDDQGFVNCELRPGAPVKGV